MRPELLSVGDELGLKWMTPESPSAGKKPGSK